MTEQLTDEQFNAVQLAWVNAVSHPALSSVLKEIAKPSNAGLREGHDLAPLLSENGLVLPKNVKSSLAAAGGGDPVGIRICVSLSDDGQSYHCILIRNPIQIF